MAKLYIVGTPIGNLSDITLRALETLKSADYIACEDTRHSLTLFNHYDIKAKLIAYHKFNEKECAEKIVALINDGNSVALVTDAGMPSVSDPGSVLVALCRKMGVDVELIPGPSAVTGAFAMCGLQSTGFTFLGFLPEKTTDKVRVVQNAAKSDLPIALYVAPHDVKKTAAFLYEVLGDRKVFVCRELTKLHESITETSLKDFDCVEKGEIVLIVDVSDVNENPLNALSVEEHLKSYLDKGMDKKEAVKRVAAERGVNKNEIYQIALNI